MGAKQLGIGVCLQIRRQEYAKEDLIITSGDLEEMKGSQRDPWRNLCSRVLHRSATPATPATKELRNKIASLEALLGMQWITLFKSHVRGIK